MRTIVIFLGGLFIALISFFIAGCGTGDTFINNNPVTVGAVLRGSQQVSSVSTSARGLATLKVNSNLNQVKVTLETNQLSDVLAVTINVGLVDKEGPVIFTLFTAAEGPLPGKITRTLSANPTAGEIPLEPRPDVGITTFAGAVQAILNGRTYINITTTANPTGEIRGQIGPVSFVTALSGFNQLPPILNAPSSATATIGLDIPQQSITVSIVSQYLVDVTAVNVEFGQPNQYGPLIFVLYTDPYPIPNTLFPTTFTAQLNQWNVITANNVGIGSFDDAVNALVSGELYINIYTRVNGAGELRGQIIPL